MVEHGWLGPIEWAAAARPLSSEEACGDQPVAVSAGAGANLFGVLDGLGHGSEAARAALCGSEVLRRDPGQSLEALILSCHHALSDTRGAAITLVRVDFDVDTLTWTGIGNVAANLVTKAPSGVEVRSSARLDSGIVGYRMPKTVSTQTVPIRPGDLLVMVSDGIAESHLGDIDFAASATVIAEQILHRHRKGTDDALVLAARHRGTLP